MAEKPNNESTVAVFVEKAPLGATVGAATPPSTGGGEGVATGAEGVTAVGPSTGGGEGVATGAEGVTAVGPATGAAAGGAPLHPQGPCTNPARSVQYEVPLKYPVMATI